ncbi:N-acetyltransferase [Streptomyces verrucosisporus]|uniref:GNAT family N-acetyltransferase n=1 Tax=Streptomyces verrucosisporus TaxID=1695161 RepID=UPI0019D0E006|nr:GNAT family N-acetyltransferase [Streptomyces verrucosisporus]MBN3931591.1 N-acetyltransferase [Streptomyces verrucosisporus]
MNGREPVRVREAAEADLEAVAALRVRGWWYAYRRLMPREYLEAMDATAYAARRRETFAETRETVTDLVAVDGGGRITGWAALGPCRGEGGGSGGGGCEEEDCRDGELYALYVEPELIGSGLGRALLAEVVRRADARRMPRLRLWVVEGNERARRFYAAAGFAPDGARSLFDAGGTPVAEVRYTREPGGAGLTAG